MYDYHTNDADMIEDIYVTSRMDFDEFHNGLTDLLGYDGIIAWNKAEGTQAVVFRSNRAKDIFNFKPTKSDDVRYSVSVNTYIPYNQIGNNNVEEVRRKVIDLYKGLSSGVADGIAISVGSTVYIVDTGKDNVQGMRIGFIKKFTISNANIRENYINHINQEAYDNGYGSRQIFEKLGVNLGNNSRNNVGRLSGTNASNTQGQSHNQQRKVAPKIGGKGVQVQSSKIVHPEDVAYANAIKNGNIAKAQAMVDKAAEAAGYTIKAYHGTKDSFTTLMLPKKKAVNI